MNTIINALNSAIESLGGQDQAIAACERMYSGTWRSEPFTISEGCDSGDLWELEDQLNQMLYIANTGNTKPDQFCEQWYDMYNDWKHENKQAVTLSDDMLVVSLCNYKGEGEGIALFDMVKHLPVFKSKSESFYTYL